MRCIIYYFFYIQKYFLLFKLYLSCNYDLQVMIYILLPWQFIIARMISLLVCVVLLII